MASWDDACSTFCFAGPRLGSTGRCCRRRLNRSGSASRPRVAVDVGGRLLQELTERSFDGVDLLIVYIDGMRFAEHHALAAVGVDMEGYAHALGL